MEYLQSLAQYTQEGKISKECANTLRSFYATYVDSAKANGTPQAFYENILNRLLELVVENTQHPYIFEPFHKHITEPFNYYQFGIDFIRPIVILDQCRVEGLANIKRVSEQIARGENVILFANHQTELDPQAISLLLEKDYPHLGEEMIFVAGHRVTTDPLAIPFSMGRNLLCIFSKKYIQDDPDIKQQQLAHNQRTMKRMGELLSEGGKCIYVAPSGGRDRANAAGVVEVDAFDPQSLEMFCLMAQHAKRATHFYPLALATYALLPPPDQINKKLGEERRAQATPIHLHLGAELDMEKLVSADVADKHERRRLKAKAVQDAVCRGYETIVK